MKYQDVNAKTIDRWVEAGWEWGTPISHEDYQNARKGSWNVKLTPTRYVPHEWFGSLKNRHVLGLASAGGQQMPIFQALGAICTVLDYSEKMLEREREVAERENYRMNCVRADMTQSLPFSDECFDLIFHPVSNCYVENILPIWQECFRILKPGGILLAGFESGLNYAFNEEETQLENILPFNPLKNPEHRKQLQQTDGGMQFSHTLEEEIGGQLQAGFILTHLYEDFNDGGRLADHHIPTYIATRSVKKPMKG